MMSGEHGYNHLAPVGFRAMGQEATYLTMHGSADELHTVQTAIESAWSVLTSLGPSVCESRLGCCYTHLIVLGQFTETDLDNIVAGTDVGTGVPPADLN